jgi:hypothetical protein
MANEPRWDVDNPDNTNGDTLLFSLDPLDPISVGFRTDADDEEAKEGIESLGVQFFGDSNGGEPDMIFKLDDGATTFDAKFEFQLDDGTIPQ